MKSGSCEGYVDSYSWFISCILTPAQQGINFMDITDTPNLGAVNTVLRTQSSIKYPSTVEKNATVLPLLKDLDKDNMRKNLEKFTSFHTRYYKSSYGAQSSAWLLELVTGIVNASGAADHGSTVKPFVHPWGQNSVIATIKGQSNKTVVIGAHQDSINLFLPSILSAPGADGAFQTLSSNFWGILLIISHMQTTAAEQSQSSKPCVYF
jgi:leucyl aminopeptidase